MGLDLNDAPEQKTFGVIPDGTFVKLKGKLRPGQFTPSWAEPLDANLFKEANAPSDAVMLDWEFTVMHGEHARSNIWTLMTVEGGKRDEQGASKAGNITKTNLRAMLDSGLGLDPKDMSDAAKAKRRMRGYSDFNGIEFAARLTIEPGQAKPDGSGFYPDKNKVEHIVVPGEPEYVPVMSGQDVPAKPSGSYKPDAHRPAAAKAAATKPAWQQDGLPLGNGGAPATAAGPAAPAWAVSQAGPAAAAGAPAAAPAATGPAAAAPAASGPAWLRQ